MAELIAVIGMGQMGSGMAGRLKEAGHDVVGYDISAEQRSRQAAAGFRMAASIKEALAGRSIVLTSLPDPKAVREAWLSSDGIVAHAGFPAVLTNLRAHWQASDREEAEWEGFLRAWRVTLGDAQVRAGEVTAALLDAANFEFRECLPDPLDDALDQEELALRSARPGSGSFTKVLGRALARKVGTRYGTENLRLERRQDLVVKVAKWQVVCDAPP